MKIIFKFLIKNIFEKKFRTFMIVFSIMLSAALLFSTNAISNNMQTIYYKQITKSSGSAEIVITPNENSPSMYFNPRKMQELQSDIAYSVPAIQLNAYMDYKDKQTVEFNLMGTDLTLLSKMSDIVLSEKGNIEPFKGKKIILSKNIASKYNLEIGDKILLEINSTYVKFQVVGIAEPTGYFMEIGTERIGVVPKNILEEINNCTGLASVMYIKVKDNVDKQGFMQELSSVYPKYDVKPTLEDAEIEMFINRLSVAFRLMSLVILLISIFIVYTCFKIISIERMPSIGTFRSIGSTKRSTHFVMSTEGVFYGVIGSVLGCFIGIGILYLMTYYTAPEWMQESGMPIEVEYTYIQLLTTFLFVVIVSFFSAVMPLNRALKFSTKEIVLNQIELIQQKKSAMSIVGIIIMLSAYFIPKLIDREFNIIINIISVIGIIISVILVMPLAVKVVIKLCCPIYQVLFKTIGVLALKNLKSDKNMLNNIALLSIALAAILIIDCFSSGLIESATNYYRDRNFEVQISSDEADKSLETSIKTVKGVVDTYGAFEQYSVEIEGYNQRIETLHGYNSNKYQDYFSVSIKDDKPEILEQLQKGRYIIFSTALQISMQLKVNQVVQIKGENGTKDYKIIGFYNSIGNEAIIGEKYIKLDMDNHYFSKIYVKTNGDAKELAERIEDAYQKRKLVVWTNAELEKSIIDQDKQLFMIMDGFAMLVLAISGIGIINNFLVTFLERRKSIAVLRSLGVDKRQIFFMTVLESSTGGLIGGIFGVLIGMLLLTIVPNILAATGLVIEVEYNYFKFLTLILISTLITMIGSVSPAIKASGLNIVETIKQE